MKRASTPEPRCAEAVLITGFPAFTARRMAKKVLAADEGLHSRRDERLTHEVLLLMGRVLRRLEMTAKSFYAIVDEGSCFAGSLLELALAADRIYMLDEAGVAMAVSPLNGGALEASNAAPVAMLGLGGGGALALSRRVREMLWAMLGLVLYPRLENPNRRENTPMTNHEEHERHESHDTRPL